MPVPLDINSPPENLDKLFESAKAELEEFKSELLVRRAVSRARALHLSNVILTSWAPMTGRITKELSLEYAKLRNAELLRLDTRAWVFYAADLAAEELHSNKAEKQRRELARTVTAHDRLLFKWATPLFGDDDEHAATLRDISRGTGARDDAEDVLRLVTLFRANWNDVKNQQKVITKANLDKAASDATKQLNSLRNSEGNPARKLADAAYSLWYYDYDELMQLGRYFVRREADLMARFPGVQGAPTRASNRGAGEVSAEAEAEVQDPSEEPSEDEVEDQAEDLDADA